MSQLFNAVIVTSKAWPISGAHQSPLRRRLRKQALHHPSSPRAALTFDSTVQEVQQLIESIFPEAFLNVKPGHEC